MPYRQPPPVATIQNTEVLLSTVRVTAIRLVSLDGQLSPGKELRLLQAVAPPALIMGPRSIAHPKGATECTVLAMLAL